MRTTVVALLTFLVAGLSTAGAGNSKRGRHWVSAWSAAVHSPLPFSDVPPSPTFDNQTIRMIVRPTIGGSRLRIRFSNEFGASPAAIGAARVAIVSRGPRIVPESDRVLTFSGKSSISIPPGAPMLSDPVDLGVSPFTEIAISIYLPRKTLASSTHFWAQHETYISGPGDLTAGTDLPDATSNASWYWLADVEIWAPVETAATVAFGDSITNGEGPKQGGYQDWPDVLASRLADGRGSPQLAVLNEGISGNRILQDGAGVSALARLDRDVLAQPGVINLIVLEGINDIGWLHLPVNAPKPNENLFAPQTVSAQELIAGLHQIINRAHEHGIRVFGATLTPYEGADYYSADGESIRQAVNQWIRTGGAFDGVFDFDVAVRDTNHPARFRDDYQSGDHLHPSAAGYKAMADAVDISALQNSSGRRRTNGR